MNILQNTLEHDINFLMYLDFIDIQNLLLVTKDKLTINSMLKEILYAKTNIILPQNMNLYDILDDFYNQLKNITLQNYKELQPWVNKEAFVMGRQRVLVITFIDDFDDKLSEDFNILDQYEYEIEIDNRPFSTVILPSNVKRSTFMFDSKFKGLENVKLKVVLSNNMMTYLKHCLNKIDHIYNMLPILLFKN